MNRRSGILFSALCLLAALAGCGTGQTPGTFVGRPGRYDYSPSVIRTGNEIRIWWCGMAKNPANPDQDSDSIQYETVDTATNQKSDPVTVLAETPKTWDNVFTCNPRIMRGTFVDPLGDGQTYTYALYYVATASGAGLANNIGVAFSNDGIHFKKYPQPVIVSNTPNFYGVGQPSLYNVDGKSHLLMFYEVLEGPAYHVEAESNDGVHFTTVGPLTQRGIDPNNANPTWGDIAYDPVTRYWYAAFNLPVRDPHTTADTQESGQYGIQIYRIPGDSLLNGSTPWQLMATFDTNRTGYESNFLAGFEKDEFGNLTTELSPKLRFFPSITTPPTPWDADPAAMASAGNLINWDIGSMVYDPAETTVTLKRYRHGGDYETTSGYIDPGSRLVADATIGHLYSSPQGGATTPFYNCKSGDKDYFVSTDARCGGKLVVGLQGYGYAPSPALDSPASYASEGSVAMYTCASLGGGHFISTDQACGGQGTGSLLGYALP